MATSNPTYPAAGRAAWLKHHRMMLIVLALLIVFPFVVAILDGQSIGSVFANETGNSKFYQGLLIEIFILALYALSYDLLLGVTGLLSFGHAMFFAVGAYVTGIMLKSLGWALLPTVGAVVVAGILQAILFAVVLPRVKGITFALVTLGMASVFHIVIQSHELGSITGGDVGLQNIPKPDWLNPADERLRFYFLALVITCVIYLFYRRFVDSPTGRVCVAIRENEDRAQMLGYNTFYFKLTALIIASLTAALAGTLHALYQPIVSPTTANIGFTVAALLMILIGGIGTLSGAVVGAAAYKLLQFFLDRAFGESSSFVLGLIYVAIVLFLPYGIVGTWQLRALQIKQGWARLTSLVTGAKRG
jgi:branched-chain amino acid transport system permease protein